MSENPITPLSTGTVGFFRRLFGPAATELGEILADKVRTYRTVNLEKVLEVAQTQIDQIHVQELPLRFSIPFFEKASLDNDQDIVNLWAKLLTDAAINFNDDHLLFVDVISRLTPTAARFLNSLVDEFYQHDDWYEEIQEDYTFRDELAENVLKAALPKMYDWDDPDSGFAIAELFFEYKGELPFMVFHVNLPNLDKKEEKKKLRTKAQTGDYGFICMAFSCEATYMNLLEREQLIRRGEIEFDASYAKLKLRYVCATPLGVRLVALQHKSSDVNKEP